MNLEQRNYTGLAIGQYSILNKIGSGAFANVYRAVSKTHNRQVAIKCIKKVDYKPHLEASLMQRLRHPNIIRLYDCFETIETVFLVEEYCNMDLFQAISTIPQFSNDIIHEIFLQLLNAVEFCHKSGIAHRDLKPENVLISTFKNDSTIRLADFGMYIT